VVEVLSVDVIDRARRPLLRWLRGNYLFSTRE
jgi:hypothetical protein